ncbi:MAG: hypothetical protein M1170_02880 [Patescibacteria group bacterium]|nr:hypothetical protein [Patescibacteria group bacterium]
MVTSELKTATVVNQDDDNLDESDDVCSGCGSELEEGVCPECDAIDDLEKSPLESDDEDWVK